MSLPDSNSKAKLIRKMLDRPTSRIDSEFYMGSLKERVKPDSEEGEFSTLDRSLLFTVRKIHFIHGNDSSNLSADDQMQMLASYPGMLINLMDEGHEKKAPRPIRAPAQICVGAVMAAEIVRRGYGRGLAMDMMERLLEQLEYAIAYYLDASQAKRCSTIPEMLDVLRERVTESTRTPLTASASLVMGFSGLLYGLVGMGNLDAALEAVEASGAEGLWYFIGEGYRFFGLPPEVCRILEERLATL